MMAARVYRYAHSFDCVKGRVGKRMGNRLTMHGFYLMGGFAQMLCRTDKFAQFERRNCAI